MGLILLLVSGPFVFIQFMPGWKSTVVVSVLYVAAIYVLSIALNDVDGPGGVFALLFAGLFMLGAVLGIVVKALFLATRKLGSPRKAVARTIGLLLIAFLICLPSLYEGWKSLQPAATRDGPGGTFALLSAGLLLIAVAFLLSTKRIAPRHKVAAGISAVVLIPAVVFSPVLYDTWQRRLPSAACSYDVVTYSVGRHRFEIPSLGIVSAMQGNGKPLKNTRQFNFVGPRSVREFCEAFDNGRKPARVDAVSLRLEEIPRARSDDRFSLLCEKGGWPQAVCGYTGSGDLGGYPLKVGIYDKAKFNADEMGGGWDYDRIKWKLARATEPSDIPGFAFDGYTYYFVDGETDADASKSPLALICYKSLDRLHCASDERWGDGVYITYGGLVSLANPVEDARALRQKARELVGQMEIDPEPDD